MARKTTRKTTTRKRKSPARRRTSARRKKKTSGGKLINFFVPLFLSACILFCLGLLFSAGFRAAASSDFFNLEKVETVGAERVSPKRVEQIVRAGAYRAGVWGADLDAIKNELESLKFVRHASVARVLPDTIRVTVTERVPRATVRIGGSDYLVDDDARVLTKVSREVRGPLPPFVMLGWDEDGSGTAREMNRKRIALYSRLVSEWRKYGLAKRVKAVDISDLRDPQAQIEDSGYIVTISLGQGDYAEGLQKGLETIAGKGGRIKYVISPSKPNPIIGYRNS